jgi:serine phosphatase RsbU (regulator of sigma subunit)
MFVTLAFGVLDPASGRVEMANAGHLRPIVRHADGRCSELQVPAGAALGVKKSAAAPTFAWTLAPGELLVLVTDGLTEAATPAGARFESERVIELVRRTGPDPKKALDALLKSARAFVAQRGFDDDLTVLCLARS